MQTKILCQFAKDSWRSATKQQSCNQNLTTVSHVRRTPKAHENAVPLPWRWWSSGAARASCCGPSWQKGQICITDVMLATGREVWSSAFRPRCARAG